MRTNTPTHSRCVSLPYCAYLCRGIGSRDSFRPIIGQCRMLNNRSAGLSEMSAHVSAFVGAMSSSACGVAAVSLIIIFHPLWISILSLSLSISLFASPAPKIRIICWPAMCHIPVQCNDNKFVISAFNSLGELEYAMHLENAKQQ